MPKDVRKQLLSGATSGFASTVILQPFDLLKTRVQQGDGSLKPRNADIILRTAKEIASTRGVSGLWRGTVPSLMRNVPGVALYFTSLTQLRTLMASSSSFSAFQKAPATEVYSRSSVLPTLNNQGNLLAGAATRTGVGLILNPFTVLKARFESNLHSYESLSGALGSMIRLGPSELFRGFVASSLRDAPYAGLFLVFYEGIKREASGTLGPDYNALTHSVSAASAGAIATLTTQPFDVIKTKIQVRNEDRYRGLLRTIRTIWSQRGLTGYFDGSFLRMSRKVFSSAIGWAVYEGALLFMHSRKPL